MDGGDYNYREKVASQYKLRVILKSQLQRLLVITAIPCLFVIAHVLQQQLKLQLPALEKLLLNLDFVEEPWLKVYALSIFTPIIGFVSMRKNHALQMTVAIVSNIVFSLMPLTAVICNEMASTNSSANLTIICILGALFGMHSLTLMQSLKLRTSWKESKSR